MMWVVLGIILAVLVLLFGLGLSLPSRQQVTRVELLKAPVTEVWEALSDLPRQTHWRTGLKSVQMLDDDHGLRWVEQPERGGAVTLRKLKELPAQELLLEMQQGSSKGTRSARMNAVPGGTRVTFTEILETRTPIGRIRARMGGGLDQRLDSFIQQLKAKFAV
jgi:uncharacterized membrane protein